MKLNNLYDIIADGWKYTVLLNIKNSDGIQFSAEMCRGLRKGEENKDFIRFLRGIDLNARKIYGGSDDAGIVIETEPVYIRKS